MLAPLNSEEISMAAIDKSTPQPSEKVPLQVRAESAERKCADLRMENNALKRANHDALTAAQQRDVRIVELEAERDKWQVAYTGAAEAAHRLNDRAESAERKCAELREALRVIATQSHYEWSETREALHNIIKAMREVALAALALAMKE
jgi:chromosome segregation ATPase